MGLVYYDIAAVFVHMLNFYIFFSRSRLFIEQSKLFSVLMFVSLGATIADIVSVISYWNVSLFSLWTLYAINILFFLFQNSISPLFALFIQSLGGRFPRNLAVRRLMMLAPWGLCFVLIISSVWTSLVFRFDAQLRYIRGPLHSLLYVFAFTYILIVVFSLLRDRRKMARDIRIAVFLFLPFSIVPSVIQFFFPELLLQNLGVSLSELIILFTIQDYGAYIDHESGLFNSDGLVIQLEMINRKRSSFTAYLVQIDTFDYLRHNLGSAAFDALQAELPRSLFGVRNADRFAAQFGEGDYVQIISAREDWDTHTARLLSRLSEPWMVMGREIYLSARICRIRFPDDAKNTEMIFRAQYCMSLNRKRYPLNTLLSLEDLQLEVPGRFVEISNAIRRALLEQTFQLYFQPIVSTATGQVVSAEALIRLHDERLGWIPPDEFIPIAEQNGTIHRIGEWVISKSCDFLSSVRASGLCLEYLEVNLSPVQCIQANLVNRILVVTGRSGLRPADICFEITETAANLSPLLMKKNVDSLVSAGFAVAIDDFGTGFSNLANLLEIQFRIIKLDRSLVIAHENSQDGRGGIKSIVSMFKPLGTELVAEGVETEAQFEAIKELGVDLVQGYYFSRPLPPDDFIAFLRKRMPVCTS